MPYLWKTITKTSEGKAFFAHGPTSCLRGPCKSPFLNSDKVYLAHYRDGCQAQLKNRCEAFLGNTTQDEAILRFRPTLIRRVERARRNLGLADN